jgi:3-hydroxyisobutyrate dehydrogenase-like beta-hydroxyacid dehydrogenase
MKIKIGFIGLGIMGSRMAANLQKKGYELVVYNRTRRKAESLIANGATWAATPEDVARQVKVIFTMLSEPEVVADMALGERGFLNHFGKNALWIDGKYPLWVDTSSVNPSFSQVMAKAASQHNVRFLDAPVDGSKISAEKGELVFYVGGDKADLEESKPLLEAMGKAIVHGGDHGMGSSLKTVNNLLMAQAIISLSEGLVLGLSLGIPRDVLLDTILSSTVAAPFLAGKRNKIESYAFDPEFPLQWMHKDLHLAMDTAYEAGIAMPAANNVKEIFALAVRAGFAEQDISAVYKIVSEKKDVEKEKKKTSDLLADMASDQLLRSAYISYR